MKRLLLYDSPTSGLDPITAKTVDAEIIKLRDLEHVTSILVTHQLDDAFYVASHQAVRENGRSRIVAADRRKASEATPVVNIAHGRGLFRDAGSGRGSAIA